MGCRSLPASLQVHVQQGPCLKHPTLFSCIPMPWTCNLTHPYPSTPASARTNPSTLHTRMYSLLHSHPPPSLLCAALPQSKTALHPPMWLSKSAEGVQVEVVLQWCADAFADTIVSFANSVRTANGGTHVDGLKASLTRTVNSLGACARGARVH